MSRPSFATMTLLAALCTGCSSDALEPTRSESAASPQQLLVDGQQWERQPELVADDEKRLSQWFKKNPSVAENPVLNGKPTPYDHEQTRRFYWHSITDKQVNWFFLEFHDGRFKTSGEGTGEPFTAAE